MIFNFVHVVFSDYENISTTKISGFTVVATVTCTAIVGRIAHMQGNPPEDYEHS